MSRSLEQDARHLICHMFYFYEKTGDWPVGSQFVQLGGYKAAADKAATVDYMIERNWIFRRSERASGHRIKMRFHGTPLGRDAVSLPAPLPPIRTEYPVPFPENPAECAIYSFLVGFFERHNRWPSGAERAHAFDGTAVRQTSKARRQRAYDNLVKDGTIVRIHLWYGRASSEVFVIPLYAPEFKDKNDWIFYAPTGQADRQPLSLGSDEGVVGLPAGSTT